MSIREELDRRFEQIEARLTALETPKPLTLTDEQCDKIISVLNDVVHNYSSEMGLAYWDDAQMSLMRDAIRKAVKNV